MIVAGKVHSPQPLPLTISRLISVQYSDTTASTLVSLFSRLVQNPEHMQKFQKELDAADDVEDFAVLRKLPHLTGIVNEILRLHPAVPTGGLRETPPGDAVVCGRFIPGNNVICAPRYTLRRRKCI